VAILRATVVEYICLFLWQGKVVAVSVGCLYISRRVVWHFPSFAVRVWVMVRMVGVDVDVLLSRSKYGGMVAIASDAVELTAATIKYRRRFSYVGFY
jgi:hypothetical protein